MFACSETQAEIFFQDAPSAEYLPQIFTRKQCFPKSNVKGLLNLICIEARCTILIRLPRRKFPSESSFICRPGTPRQSLSRKRPFQIFLQTFPSSQHHPGEVLHQHRPKVHLRQALHFKILLKHPRPAPLAKPFVE